MEAFIYGIADSVRDRPISSIKESQVCSTVHTIISIVEEAGKVLDRNPREDTGSRFGNPVFRTFLDDVEASLSTWHAQLGLTDKAQVDEISAYLYHSFGNKRRIDYGSGHELNFFL